MRIISGKYKGLRLKFNKTVQLRPTKDRVKESLFSMLGDICDSAICLDLFAGTGALGLEAISRGAKYIDFVDVDCSIVKSNLNLIKDFSAYQVHKIKAEKFLKDTTKKYDLIFIDPPWNIPEYYEKVLALIIENNILANNGYVILEQSDILLNIDAFEMFKERKFGNTIIKILEQL